MPWPAVKILDDLAPPAIDQQRRNMIGGDASVRMFPWVGVQQLHLRPSESPHKGRRAARQPREATPRVAVCVAGAARALIHPLVWRSLDIRKTGTASGDVSRHWQTLARPLAPRATLSPMQSVVDCSCLTRPLSLCSESH